MYASTDFVIWFYTISFDTLKEINLPLLFVNRNNTINPKRLPRVMFFLNHLITELEKPPFPSIPTTGIIWNILIYSCFFARPKAMHRCENKLPKERSSGFLTKV